MNGPSTVKMRSGFLASVVPEGDGCCHNNDRQIYHGAAADACISSNGLVGNLSLEPAWPEESSQQRPPKGRTPCDQRGEVQTRQGARGCVGVRPTQWTLRRDSGGATARCQVLPPSDPIVVRERPAEPVSSAERLDNHQKNPRGTDLGKRWVLQRRRENESGFGLLLPKHLLATGGANLVGASSKASRQPTGSQEDYSEHLERRLH